jgi:hypothetical protein
MRDVRRCRPEAKKCTMDKRTEAQRRESFRKVNASCAVEDRVMTAEDLALQALVAFPRAARGTSGSSEVSRLVAPGGRVLVGGDQVTDIGSRSGDRRTEHMWNSGAGH